MLQNKKEHPCASAKATSGTRKEKTNLHSRNRHRKRYDFKQLIASCPDLAQFVKLNKYDDESIDFSNPEAVKMLNKALLKYNYGINNWNIPPNYLCPPIPGRADYIHYIADLLGGCAPKEKIPTGKKITCLDIGVGANCVYPIIGNKEYGWRFIGSDIDTLAIESATKIVELNQFKKDDIELRLQLNPKDIFKGIIIEGERIDLTICNPPFHSSMAEAQSATLRKVSNLKKKKITKPILNFGGQSNELWYEGGEKRFVSNMIRQSKEFANSCFWFSSLISKQSNLKSIYKLLTKVEAVDIKTIQMGQGNKISRIVAWTFLNQEEQKKWITGNW
ncbi:MAG: 23S rRNA (adenine(1618)-N(6))-methyltransferase RlmF [Bacteroidetes bacterium]|nr:MAG: 23S rRNA (adenine(1618)-N(6))-methyltransferase RlmF [Bacteroidota bacterium]